MQRLTDSTLLRSGCYVDGLWLVASDQSTVTVSNPANGEVLGTVPNCGVQETQQAITAANQAFMLWRKKTVSYRAQILRQWFNLVIEHQDDLALIMTLEQGKPLAEAKAEILYAASYLEWFSEEAKRAYGDVIPSPFDDKRLFVLKEPIGVCAAITPWNFPSAMITRKAGAALAAGCSIVLKPAQQTPLSALALAELAHRAGVPAGVFNVITGKAQTIGGELTSSPIVRKLSFTGSTDIGCMLMAQCAPTMKKLSMELGGNAPFIVFEDADIDAAVDGALMSKFRNAGQTCVCSNRFFVHEAVYSEFATKLAEKVATITVGNGTDEGVDQGPLIDLAAINKVAALVDNALEKGASIACGGKRHRLGKLFYEPTVITDVTPEMNVAIEEIFGPVAPILKFQNEEDVIRLANDTEFGLAAYFYARDIGKVWRVAEALEYGMVGINTGAISTPVAPFGGVKSSGNGREGSKYGLDDYMETKYIAMGGL